MFVFKAITNTLLL